MICVRDRTGKIPFFPVNLDRDEEICLYPLAAEPYRNCMNHHAALRRPNFRPGLGRTRYKNDILMKKLELRGARS